MRIICLDQIFTYFFAFSNNWVLFCKTFKFKAFWFGLWISNSFLLQSFYDANGSLCIKEHTENNQKCLTFHSWRKWLLRDIFLLSSLAFIACKKQAFIFTTIKLWAEIISLLPFLLQRTEIDLIVVDVLISAIFDQTNYQRCIFHFFQNILTEWFGIASDSWFLKIAVGSSAFCALFSISIPIYEELFSCSF